MQMNGLRISGATILGAAFSFLAASILYSWSIARPVFSHIDMTLTGGDYQAVTMTSQPYAPAVWLKPSGYEFEMDTFTGPILPEMPRFLFPPLDR